MKVAINVIHGGFSVSPEAAQWMYDKGWKELATPVEKYFTNRDEKESLFSLSGRLKTWREHKDNKADNLFVTAFTADEKFVLDMRPDDRTNPILIECIETLGEAANARFSNLKIVEIPDDVEYEIEEYDGKEWIAEKHRIWS